MRLIRYSQGSQWTVFLHSVDAETCQILDTLGEAGDLGERMLADLRKVASRPIQSLQRDVEFSSKIEGTKLFEFRMATTRGPTPRVLYFFDKGRIIICVLALLKKTQKLPPEIVRAAEDIQTEYLRSGGMQSAEICDIDDEEEFV